MSRSEAGLSRRSYSGVSLFSNTSRSRPISKSQAPVLSMSNSKPNVSNTSKNPFRVPLDNDIFTLREYERETRQKQRKEQQKLKVHEKTTYVSRVNARTAEMRNIVENILSDDEDVNTKEDDGIVEDDPQFTLAITKDRNVEKENLSNFIAKKREMFLVQYALGVKRDEMRKLEEIAQAEEKKLEIAEQYLEEDAQMFDEFLKENDKNAVDAIKIAENETKAKLEKVSDIKKINAQMMAIKSEISKYEDTLKDYLLYKHFLDSLTPPEFNEKLKLKRAVKQKSTQELQTKPSTFLDKGSIVEKKQSKQNRKDSKVQIKPIPSSITSKGYSQVESVSEHSLSPTSHQFLLGDSSDEEPELYFTDPQQLLDIFTELEEQNLSLIQNSQETEEALEELKQTTEQTKQKWEKKQKF